MKIALTKPSVGPNGKAIDEVEVAIPASLSDLHTPPAGVDLAHWYAAKFTAPPLDVVKQFDASADAIVGAAAHALLDAWDRVRELRLAANRGTAAR